MVFCGEGFSGVYFPLLIWLKGEKNTGHDVGWKGTETSEHCERMLKTKD